MYVTCLDMEGVLVPEIWIAFAEASGIPELKRTTRDEPDYSATFASRLRTRSATPTSVPVTEGVSSIFFKNFLSTLAMIGSSHI